MSNIEFAMRCYTTCLFRGSAKFAKIITSIAREDIKLFENEEEDDEIERALNYLITQPQDEHMLDFVKSSGKKLCMDLSPEKRKERINGMIIKIKRCVDAEHTQLTLYEEQKKQLASNPEELTKLGFQIGKCEERMQTLTNLMLHCCSGLQDSHDVAK